MYLPRRRARWADLLDLNLDPRSERALFQQIYLLLRDAIVGNALSPGSRLPSTRDLARRLKVSRTSVLAAYEQLLSEGYILGREGSGTYVSDDVPQAIAADPAAGPPAPDAPPRLSQAGFHFERIGRELGHPPGNIPFATGCCSIDAATIEAWRRIGAQQMRTFDPVNLGYADPVGEAELRAEVAEYLRAARAVRCEPNQVIVVGGAQQAIDLSIRALLEPGDTVWVEDPGYRATREALIAAGIRLAPVAVDASGLMVEQGIAMAPTARAAFITPSHQYPTGSVMSMERRLELLAWAARTGAWIVEDDYDSEFRYVGRPLSSLQGLDRNSRAIYTGTLSKVLFPGVRLGFAVVPSALAEAYRGGRFLSDRFPSTLQQAMVAEFMRQGHLASHIRRMRQRYLEARDVVAESYPSGGGRLAVLNLRPDLSGVCMSVVNGWGGFGGGDHHGS